MSNDFFLGTMFFNLTKANNTLWRRLIQNKNKKIPIWWHMNTVQSPEMSEFARMLDDEDEARERVLLINNLIFIFYNIFK